MHADTHRRAQGLLDESLIGGISSEDAGWLRNQLEDCGECARHAELTNRAVHGLGSLAFGGDDGMSARTQDRIAAHARRRAVLRVRSRWIGIAAAVLIGLSVPIYRQVREARQAAEDAVLLERVEQRVSRPVPAAMEPLWEESR
jgi:hypothetical protein